MTRAQVDTCMMCHQQGMKRAAGQTQSHRDVCVTKAPGVQELLWESHFSQMSLDERAERRM